MTAPVAVSAASSSAVASATVARYGAITEAMRSRLIAALLALWNGLGGTRDAQAATFVQNAVPLVQGGQQAMAALTAAYLGQVDPTGSSSSSAALPAATLAGLRGIAPEAVYQRPFTTVWTSLSKGKPYDQAVADGQRRLVSLAATDLQLAKTHQAQATFAGMRGVAGYRRALGPDEHHCALCLLTSSRVYHKSDLMPIHPACACTPVPVVGGEHVPEIDPEAVHAAIANTLGDKYVQAGGRGPVDYRDIVVVRHHGELGPVLAARGQHFAGPSDL